MKKKVEIGTLKFWKSWICRKTFLTLSSAHIAQERFWNWLEFIHTSEFEIQQLQNICWQLWFRNQKKQWGNETFFLKILDKKVLRIRNPLNSFWLSAWWKCFLAVYLLGNVLAAWIALFLRLLICNIYGTFLFENGFSRPKVSFWNFFRSGIFVWSLRLKMTNSGSGIFVWPPPENDEFWLGNFCLTPLSIMNSGCCPSQSIVGGQTKIPACFFEFFDACRFGNDLLTLVVPKKLFPFVSLKIFFGACRLGSVSWPLSFWNLFWCLSL